ncbi:MAG: hypothetical protein GY796_15465 [Chloroflexi bacterium]|nr:hypothetical protein [Chloroflexota bacterium]
MMNRRLALLVGACIVGLGLFLGVTAVYGGQLGFPLDDAWIHQTYARNLARHGRFEFVPGSPSSGSTAPLWTLLLTIGYWLQIPYLLWTYLLGGLSLLWLAAAVMQSWRLLWPQLAAKDWLVGLLIIFMWPMLWAAVSGMETLLFAALGMQLIALYLTVIRHPSSVVRHPSISQSPNLQSLLPLGFLSGLLILTRPEGIALVGLVGLGLFLRPGGWLERVKRVGVLGGTAVLPLLPYFLFNYWSNGTLWPNTMAAKQTEYAVLLARPIIGRTVQLLYLSLGGAANGWQGMSSAHLLLLPGLIWASWLALKADWTNRHLVQTLPLLWASGHVFLYAWKLPVTYQHGRYLLAIMPVWIMYGLAGWLLLLFVREGGRSLWLAQKVAQFTFAIVLFFFLLQGAAAYAADVAIIEGEMVTVAHWLAENTDEDAVIATHDIGAIGYFAERPLLDLAGLITPEIIPLLDDEPALSQYILQSAANYLVTAPGWPYADITQTNSSTFMYSTDFQLTQENGINNMAVYKLPAP